MWSPFSDPALRLVRTMASPVMAVHAAGPNLSEPFLLATTLHLDANFTSLDICQAEAVLGDKDKRDEVDAVMRHARVQVLKP